MAELKPIYLVSGDDDAKIDAWRARLRERAESEGGPGALEAHDASSSAPLDMAASLSMLTMAAGTRYLLADGAQAWKAKDLEPLEDAMAASSGSRSLAFQACAPSASRKRVPAAMVSIDRLAAMSSGALLEAS